MYQINENKPPSSTQRCMQTNSDIQIHKENKEREKGSPIAVLSGGGVGSVVRAQPVRTVIALQFHATTVAREAGLASYSSFRTHVVSR